jgi:RimJ/RimL family protein N-acetyltransferase
MTQFVIECGPLSLVWIPNPLAPLTTKIKSGVFEMRSGPEYVGTISFVGTRPPHAVIGYEVLPEFRGRGFASSAVAAVLSVAPDFGFNVLTAQCRSNNAHSRRVLEKTGFILSSSAPFWTNTPSSTKARRSTKKRDMSLLFMVYQWIATPDATISDIPLPPERPMK